MPAITKVSFASSRNCTALGSDSEINLWFEYELFCQVEYVVLFEPSRGIDG